MKRVSIVKCHSYDYEIVEQKVLKCLDNAEGLKDKIKEGNKVLAKTKMFDVQERTECELNMI